MRSRGIGVALVVTGGALEIARIVITQLVLPSIAASPLIVALVSLTPSLLIAIGAMVVGTSYRARGRLGFMIAGASGMLFVAVNGIQILLDSPLGPAPSLLASALAFAATGAGAALLLADRTVRTPDRWALAIPAGCMVLFALCIIIVPWDVLLAIPAVGYIFGGFQVLRSAKGITSP
ncbi:MAG: hypothetical protein QM677_06630 [Microbacterium sp.]